MNYKLLFPTYRNRYVFVREQLRRYSGKQGFVRALNLGTGEGDYDPMIAAYCAELIGCDINEADIRFARRLNADIPNLTYQVENALDLSFPDSSFDLLVSVEVIEHVGRPERMVEEIRRVLRPGGLAIMTFPSEEFPVTYDPVNKALRRLTGRHISEGAYAFGHEYLIKPADFRAWCGRHGLTIVEEQNLSGHLVGLTEMYWTGWVQRLFKANAANVNTDDRGSALRPSRKEPALARVTDALLAVDRALFRRMAASVGKGFVLRKEG